MLRFAHRLRERAERLRREGCGDCRCVTSETSELFQSSQVATLSQDMEPGQRIDCYVAVPSSNVLQSARRQPWRDRDPCVPCRLRTGRRNCRGVPVRGPQLGPPPEGGRGVPDRRGRSSRSGRTCRWTRSSTPPSRAGADAIYPGYGFLSENPDLAAACADAGITFVGPSAEILELTGNKARAIAAAKAAGLPVLASSEPSADVESCSRPRREHAFPDLRQGRRRWWRTRHAPRRRARPVAGVDRSRVARGGVGVRRSDGVPRAGRDRPPAHRGADPRRQRTATSSISSSATARVQRRHQKVIELAPAPNLDPAAARPDLRGRGRVRKEIGYPCAGTVEFLVDTRGNHVFIEMNPRIQVEHTVTEEITDVDLVQAQLRIAPARSLEDLGLTQDTITHPRCGAAVPHHDRGSRQRVPARHRTHHRVPHPRRRRYPPRRWHDSVGAEVSALLRLDAGQAHLPRPRLRRRGGACPPRGRRVPYPRCLHEHPVPAGRSRRRGLPGGARRRPRSSSSARSC